MDEVNTNNETQGGQLAVLGAESATTPVLYLLILVLAWRFCVVGLNMTHGEVRVFLFYWFLASALEA